MKSSIHLSDNLFYTSRIKVERFLDKVEKERKEALASQDCSAYFTLCNRLGRTPEDKLLYEQGEAQNLY